LPYFIPKVISFLMNSRASKIIISLATIGAGSFLTSCQLGAAKYTSQTEVETEVPESLEQGKPSEGPPPGQGPHIANEGVPAGSNLTDSAETPPPATHLPALPISNTRGGAPMTADSTEISRNLIDIPSPDFAALSVHTPRTPANMLTLDRQPLAAPASLNAAASSALPVIQEPVPAVPTASVASEPSATAAPANAEIANGPKTSPAVPNETVAPAPTEPGIPLLHSAARLSDFYAALHQPLLDDATANNTTPPAESVTSPQPEETELPPPPPPAETAFGSPAAQQ
jgi:hypothetical protein